MLHDPNFTVCRFRSTDPLGLLSLLLLLLSLSSAQPSPPVLHWPVPGCGLGCVRLLLSSRSHGCMGRMFMLGPPLPPKLSTFLLTPLRSVVRLGVWRATDSARRDSFAVIWSFLARWDSSQSPSSRVRLSCGSIRTTDCSSDGEEAGNRQKLTENPKLASRPSKIALLQGSRGLPAPKTPRDPYSWMAKIREARTHRNTTVLYNRGSTWTSVRPA